MRGLYAVTMSLKLLKIISDLHASEADDVFEYQHKVICSEKATIHDFVSVAFSINETVSLHDEDM